MLRVSAEVHKYSGAMCILSLLCSWATSYRMLETTDYSLGYHQHMAPRPYACVYTMCANLHNKINHNISFSKRNSGTQGQRPPPGIFLFESRVSNWKGQAAEGIGQEGLKNKPKNHKGLCLNWTYLTAGTCFQIIIEMLAHRAFKNMFQ